MIKMSGVHVSVIWVIISTSNGFLPIRCLNALLWRQNGHDGVSNHQPDDCLLNCPCRRRSKKTSKLRATGLCVGNSPGTGEFPAQMASNAENVSIWWRHHECCFIVSSCWTIRDKAQIVNKMQTFSHKKMYSKCGPQYMGLFFYDWMS